MIESFPPIISPQPQLLIVGTMPGIASLRQKQYYGHPQNAFWKILFEVFEKPFSKTYEDRVNLIKDHQLALWDTLQYCYREGSLDSAIKSEQPNDILGLLNKFPTITKILCNGQMAGKYLQKYHNIPGSIDINILPSTSPANATIKYAQKLLIWKSAIKTPPLANIVAK